MVAQVVATFQSPDGQEVGPSLTIPANITPAQLELLLNQLLQNVRCFSFG